MNTKKILLGALLAGAFGGAAAAPEAGQDSHDAHTIVIHKDGKEVAAGDQERDMFVRHLGDAPRLAALGMPGEPMLMEGMPMMEGANNFAITIRQGRPVKNAPYSAEAVSESVQTLPDGNQITRSTSSLSYRDSAGRTRNEVRNTAGETRQITIHEGDGASLLLDPAKKTATRIVRRTAGPDQGAANGQTEIKTKDGDVIVKRIERVEAPRDGARRNTEVQVRRMEFAHGAAPGGMPFEALSHSFGDMKWTKNAVTKDLGTKEIGGVKAEGKLRSYVIPAGEIGNKDAITVSNETWTSPELQITLYSKRSDPRTGERIYRLENLKRAEPAAALFTMPEGYAVKEIDTMIRRHGADK